MNRELGSVGESEHLLLRSFLSVLQLLSRGTASFIVGVNVRMEHSTYEKRSYLENVRMGHLGELLPRGRRNSNEDLRWFLYHVSKD